MRTTGFQYGWLIRHDDIPFLRLWAGGTGPCWNIIDPEDEDGTALHVCELDDLIAALTAFRDHEANRANARRWAG